MKIGIYNPRVGVSDAGGTETFLREMMRRLQYNHEVVLYCGDGELITQVEDLSIDIRPITFTRKESRFNAILARWTPLLPAEVESLSMYWNAKRSGVFDEIDDHVDVLSTHYYLDNLLVSRSVTTPTLFRFPGIKQPSVRWKVMAKFADPDTYLANSEATATRLRNWLGLDTDGTVYAGVNKEQFASDVDPAFEDNRVAILFVGRLDEGKGLGELVEAQSRLTKTTRLYLVGDGTLRSNLESDINDRGLDESIRFVGPVPHDEIQRYYAAADIFCLPSHHESLGLVNLEAMAAGTPVVTTRIDAIEEYISNGENGVLVPPGDVRALTDALDQLAGDPDLRTRLAASGRATASQFSWSSQARKIETFYEETSDQ